MQKKQQRASVRNLYASYEIHGKFVSLANGMSPSERGFFEGEKWPFKVRQSKEAHGAHWEFSHKTVVPFSVNCVHRKWHFRGLPCWLYWLGPFDGTLFFHQLNVKKESPCASHCTRRTRENIGREARESLWRVTIFTWNLCAFCTFSGKYALRTSHFQGLFRWLYFYVRTMGTFCWKNPAFFMTPWKVGAGEYPSSPSSYPMMPGSLALVKRMGTIEWLLAIFEPFSHNFTTHMNIWPINISYIQLFSRRKATVHPSSSPQHSHIWNKFTTDTREAVTASRKWEGTTSGTSQNHCMTILCASCARKLSKVEVEVARRDVTLSL